MLTLTITNEQQILDITLNPVTKAGKPAKLDGAPVWERVSGTSLLSNVALDGMSASLISSYEVEEETAVFKITGDADLGAGVVTIEEDITLIVIKPLADNFGILPGTITTKPTVAPAPATAAKAKKR